jgi:hypothetical protein
MRSARLTVEHSFDAALHHVSEHVTNAGDENIPNQVLADRRSISAKKHLSDTLPERLLATDDFALDDPFDLLSLCSLLRLRADGPLWPLTVTGEVFHEWSSDGKRKNA